MNISNPNTSSDNFSYDRLNKLIGPNVHIAIANPHSSDNYFLIFKEKKTKNFYLKTIPVFFKQIISSIKNGENLTNKGILNKLNERVTFLTNTVDSSNAKKYEVELKKTIDIAKKIFENQGKTPEVLKLNGSLKVLDNAVNERTKQIDQAIEELNENKFHNTVRYVFSSDENEYNTSVEYLKTVTKERKNLVLNSIKLRVATQISNLTPDNLSEVQKDFLKLKSTMNALFPLENVKFLTKVIESNENDIEEILQMADWKGIRQKCFDNSTQYYAGTKESKISESILSDVLLPIQRHYRKKRIPLRAHPQVPKISHKPSEEQINNYANKLPEEFKTVFKTAVDNLQHVTLSNLEESLKSCVLELNQHLKQTEEAGKSADYSVGISCGKSNQWVASLASKHTEKLPNSWCSLYDGTKSKGLSVPIYQNDFSRATENNFVFYDDCSYSGTQMCTLINNLKTHLAIQNSKEEKPEPKTLYVVVPYITKTALNKIKALDSESLKIVPIYSKTILTINEVFPEKTDYVKFQMLLGNGFRSEGQTLTYTDWRKPDDVSFNQVFGSNTMRVPHLSYSEIEQKMASEKTSIETNVFKMDYQAYKSASEYEKQAYLYSVVSSDFRVSHNEFLPEVISRPYEISKA